MVDFYSHVPKDLEENLQYRLDLRHRAEEDGRFRRAVWEACREDVLFFLNALCWVYEPRTIYVDGIIVPKMLPMITWPHQDQPIRDIRKYLGTRDIGVEKSRAQGMSWIGVLLALHDWLFTDGAKVSLVSSTEKMADNPENPDSLFWKVDWELTKLPLWLAGEAKIDWKRNIDQHSLVNLRNGSRITAYACTADLARGGRASWFLMDELASWQRGPDEDAMRSTQHVTRSRLLVSTPDGTHGAYYRSMHEPSNIVKIVIDWKDNPWQNRGLYRHVNGAPVALDPDDNPLPAHYDPPNQETLDLFSRLRAKGFKLAGETRSPWYDEECDRANATPQSVAKELDRDYGGSQYHIFGLDFFQACESTVRKPFLCGLVDYDVETMETRFDKMHNGPMKIWTALDANGRPPRRQYCLGADISSGLGGNYTSNSVLEVVDLTTMSQVFEYATNTEEPERFAETAMAVAYWFHDAFLIWESNYGGAFTKRIIDKKYPHVYYRQTMWQKSKRKRRMEVGWWSDDRTKDAAFGALRSAVRSGELIIRSEELAKECGHYVMLNGKIEHALMRSSSDDSSKGRSHGDRVIAMAVCLQGTKDRPAAALKGALDEKNPPPGTIAARLRRYEDEARKRMDDAEDLWDEIAYGSFRT